MGFGKTEIKFIKKLGVGYYLTVRQQPFMQDGRKTVEYWMRSAKITDENGKEIKYLVNIENKLQINSVAHKIRDKFNLLYPKSSLDIIYSGENERFLGFRVCGEIPEEG